MTHKVILFLGAREGEGWGGRTRRGPCGWNRIWKTRTEAHLAARLTQTIKTAEARIHLSERREERFCI